MHEDADRIATRLQEALDARGIELTHRDLAAAVEELLRAEVIFPGPSVYRDAEKP
ncbi:MAG TPA: hypothetical protein VN213_13610 [Solirubrobacteraceae bacterium]|nr:hypothetical protein [Solirubrobacteraceae bacterium]HYC76227.1 hypothetical protein [Planctomycetota bacterium]